MKIIAVNGSTRRNGNTAELLGHALQGAADMGAETELIHLRDLDFRGCSSCFSCKRKDKEHGVCAMQDGLSPLLEALKTVDGVVLGSPIYYGNLSADMLAFLERLLFSNSIYSNEIPSVFPKRLPWGMIYTMNVTQPEWEQYGWDQGQMKVRYNLSMTFRQKPQLLYSFNTLQFSDYSQYEASKFSPEEKSEQHRTQFPRDCQAAYQMGKQIAEKANRTGH